MYYSVTKVLVYDLENSLVRFAEQGAATIESYLSARIFEVRSIAANSIINNTSLPLTQRLDELTKQLHIDEYRRLSIADLEGNSVTTEGVELFIGDREYYRKALQGIPNISDPIKSRVDGKMAIVFAVPVMENSTIAGVLYGTYDADVLSRMTDKIKLTNNGSTFIINRSGDIIAHDNRQLVYDIHNDFEHVKEDPQIEKLVSLEKKMIAGEKGTGDYKYYDEDRYMGYSPIRETGWSIAVTAPKKAVFGTLNIVFLMLSIIIIITSLIIGVILTHSRQLRINLLRQQVNSLRITDFTNLIALTIKCDGTILKFNRYAEDILLYLDQFGEEKVKNIYELLSEVDSGKLKSIIEGSLYQSSSTSFELAFKRGDSRITNIYCSAISDKENSGVFEMLGIDISERVEQENRIQDSFEELTAVYGELAVTEDTIRQLAYKDSLTGLLNRVALYEEMEKVISGKNKTDRCALLYLDLDNFKYINDSFGHSTGDILISEIGKRLQKVFSDNEIVARFEGDEFVIFVKRVQTMDELKDRINCAMGIFDEPFTLLENNIFHISASCGVCIYPEHANSIEDMLKGSDMAMYRAKKDGKNKYIMFEQNMNDEFFERIDMENGLRKAIENNEFLLYYQPQIDLITGKISGFEALIRWQHVERGMIPPLKFIGVAEETGLIVVIGRWVLETACIFIKELNESKRSNFKISVNISVMQIMQADFVDMVKGVLEKTGLKPELLELEITESKLVEAVDLNLKKLRELRLVGVKLSIDDFGTGFSSLSYLKQLPIDTLKIDKSFVDDIPEHDNSMIESIIHIGHQRNLRVIAEGVEKQEQMEFLVRHKCDMVQGYYYSRPVSEEDAKKLI